MAFKEQCVDCQAVVTVEADTETARKTLKNRGWFITLSDKFVCPSCAVRRMENPNDHTLWNVRIP
jgi:hypothetical protein